MFDQNGLFAEADFTAELRPMLAEDGTPIPEHFARAVHRTDTGEVIAVAGSVYKPIQHMDVLSPLLDRVEGLGYDVQERAPDKANLYDLQGKKGIFGQVKTADKGAVMLAELIFGDFVQPTGSTAYLDKGPDTLFRRVRVINSHNQKYGVRVTIDYLRLICLNGLVDAQFSASSYGRHTTNFDVDGLKAKINFGLDSMEEDADRFGLYARTPLSIEQATTFIQRTLAKLSPEAGQPRHSERKVAEILRLFAHEDQTVWGLMQAMTYWSTHGDLRKGSNEVTSRITRDESVASALRSEEFGELIAA